MRKSFTGPVWLLVLFGLLQSGVAYSYISLMQRIVTENGGGNILLFALRTSLFPAVILAEALVYWWIRKRNRAQLLSWTHAVIFCVAFILSGLGALTAILHLPLGAGLRTTQGRMVETAIFWALVAVSHVAFIQVLILAFRKEPPLKNSGGEPENLLDDVVL